MKILTVIGYFVSPRTFRLFGTEYIIHTDVTGEWHKEVREWSDGYRHGGPLLSAQLVPTSTPNHYKVLKIKRYHSNYLKPLLDSFLN